MMEEYLRLCNIHTQGAVTTNLNDFCLTVFQGEVLFLAGNFNVGKTALKEFLSGNLQKTKGDIYINEEKINTYNENIANIYGIYIIDSKKRLIDTMTIEKNLFVVRKRSHILKPFFYRKKISVLETNKLLEKLDLKYNPTTYIYNLSIFEKYLICFAKAAANNARLIIFDCNDMVFNNNQYIRLEQIFQKLTKKGVSFIIIDEKPNVLLSVANRACILRKGKIQKLLFKEDLERGQLMKCLHPIDQQEKVQWKKPEIEVKTQLFWKDEADDFKLSVKMGEIIGFYDTMWDSNYSFLDYLRTFNERNKLICNFFDGSKLSIFEEDMLKSYPAIYISQNSVQALFEHVSIRKNLSLPIYKKICRIFGIIPWSVTSYMEKVFLKEFSLDETYKSVSDLNPAMKKIFSIYRWMLVKPKVLIVENPMIALDIEGQRMVEMYMRSIAEKGVSILLFSQEYEEQKRICTRIIYTQNGTLWH